MEKQLNRIKVVLVENNRTNKSWFSTIGATTKYFPHSGIRTDSIPGNAVLSDPWEFSSDKSKTKWSVGVTFNPPFPTTVSYLAYNSSIVIVN